MLEFKSSFDTHRFMINHPHQTNLKSLVSNLYWLEHQFYVIESWLYNICELNQTILFYYYFFFYYRLFYYRLLLSQYIYIYIYNVFIIVYLFISKLGFIVYVFIMSIILLRIVNSRIKLPHFYQVNFVQSHQT
jgi:hypothetical protein